MAENNFNAEPGGPAALRHSQGEPRGVLHGNLKLLCTWARLSSLSLLRCLVQSARRIQHRRRTNRHSP